MIFNKLLGRTFSSTATLRFGHKVLLPLAIVNSIVLLIGNLHADSSFTGSGTLWGDAANWAPAGVPDSVGTNVFFDVSANPSLNGASIVLGADRTLGSLSLSGALASGAASSLSFAPGNWLIFSNTGATPSVLELSGNLNASVASNVRLASDLQLRNDSNYANSLALSGTIDTNGKTLFAEPSALASSLRLTSVISGAGVMQKIGDGTLYLSGNNTYSGGTRLTAGTLQIESNTALGSGVLSVMGPATLRTSSSRSLSNALDLSATPILSVNGGGSLLFNNVAGAVLGQATMLNIDTNTRLSFGSASSLTGAYALVKDGYGTLTLSGSNSTFTSLAIRNGYVTTGTFTGELVLGAAAAGKNILGTGPVSITGDDTAGADTSLTINGALGSLVTISGSLLVERGATLRINNASLNLDAGSIDFGTGAQKGRFYSAGDVTLGNTMLLNSSGGALHFERNVTIKSASTLAASGVDLYFDDAANQSLNALTAGDALFVGGNLHKTGTATLTIASGVGSLAQASGKSLYLDAGSISLTAVNQLPAGNLVLGNATQLNLGGFNQNFASLVLPAGSQGTLAFGGASTVGLGAVTQGAGSTLKLRDWSATSSSITATSVSNPAAVWFYGYNKGAAYTSGTLTPSAGRLTSEWTNASPNNNWLWGDYRNWRNIGDLSVDEFNVPNAPGAYAKIGTLAGNTSQKIISLGNNTAYTLGRIEIDAASGEPLYFNGTSSRFIFDTGVPGTMAEIKQTSGSWYAFNVLLELRSDTVFNNTAGGYPSISGGMIGPGNFYKTGSGELRIAYTASTGLGAYTGDIFHQAGNIMIYANNVMGSGVIHLQGGSIANQFNTIKYAISNKLSFETPNFTTNYTRYTYAGDVDIGSAGPMLTLNVTDITTVSGQRASVTFDSGFNLTGTSGLTFTGAAGTKELLSKNNSFTGGMILNGGILYTTLTGDQIWGASSTNQNYLGAGNITTTGSTSLLSITNGGFLTTLRNNTLAVTNSSNIALTGNGALVLESGTFSGGATGTPGALSIGGDLTVGDTVLVNSPNLIVNNTIDTIITATNATTTISGLGTLIKRGPGQTTLSSAVTSLGAQNLRIEAGSFRLGADNAITNTTALALAGGVFDANGHTQQLGSLSLINNSGILLGATGKLTFASIASGTTLWNPAAQLNIQNDGNNASWFNQTTYVRLVDATNLDAAKLSHIAFTGYEVGATSTTSGIYTYVIPNAVTTHEWNGSANPDRNWSNATNWLGGTPNGAGASATIRDLDSNLDTQVITIDAPVAVGHLNIESSAGQTYTLNGSNTLTINGADGRIRQAGGSTVTLAAPIELAVNTALDTLVAKQSGYLNWTGAISGAGNLTKNGEGTLRISGNNTAYTGDFAWTDSSVIQVAGNGAIFGNGIFRIGTPASATTYYLEAYGSSTRTVSTPYSLGGNLYLQKQTDAAVTSGSTLNGRLNLAGAGTFESGTHVITVWGNGSSYSQATEYNTLALTGKVTGAGAIYKTGIGFLLFSGTGNDFSGGVIQRLGEIQVAADNALGTGIYDIAGAANTTHLRSLATGTDTINLPNELILSTGNAFYGNMTFNRSGTSTLVNQFAFGQDSGTVIFSAGHILTGTGGIQKGGRGGYSSTGIIRFEGANTYTGVTDLQDGIIQVGADSIKNSGTLISGALGVGTFNWNGGRLSAYSAQGSGITTRRLSNRTVLAYNSMNVGKTNNSDADTLIFDTGTIALRNGTSDLSMNIDTGATLNIESRLIDANNTTAGGITKTLPGALELSNGDNVITAGIRVTSGTLRAVHYTYDTDGKTKTGISTGDITLGALDAGKNYLGTGALQADGSTALIETVTTADSTVTLAARTDGLATLTLDNAGRFNANTGNLVLGNGVRIDSTTPTVRGTLTAANAIHAGTALIGVNIVAPNLILTPGTLKPTADNLFAGLSQLTLNGGTFDLNATNQTIGGNIDIASSSTLAFGTNTDIRMIKFNTLTGADNHTLNIVNWKGNAITGGGLDQIVLTGVSSLQHYNQVNFGSQYTLGAISRYNGSAWVLVPLGKSFFWDGRTSLNWQDTNWQEYNADTTTYENTTTVPNTPGVGATIRSAGTLNGQTLSLGTPVTIAGITIDRPASESFTLGTTGQVLNLDAAGGSTYLNTTGSNNTNTTIAANINLALGAGAGTSDLILTTDGSGTLNITGNIGGNQAVTKAGQGTLRLAGDNRFTEGLTLNAGRIDIAANGTPTSGPLGAGNLIVNGGTLQAADTARTLLANDLIINGTLTLAGTNALTLAKTNGTIAVTTTNATINVENTTGTLTLAQTLVNGTNALTLAKTNGTIAVTTTNATINVENTTGTLTLAQTLVNGTNAPVALIKTGTGTLVLDANNSTYADTIALRQGTLKPTNNNALGSGTLAMTGTTGGGTLDLTGTDYTLATTIAVAANASGTLNTGAGNDTLTGSINGSGTLAKIGSGTLTLSGSGNYAGQFNAVEATTRLTSNAALGTGTLAISSTATAELAMSNATLATTIAGNGQALITGTALRIASQNTAYTGTWTIAQNASALINDGANLGTTSAVNISGTLTVDPTGSTTLTTSLTGTGILIKDNTGNLTLVTASPAYTGSTLITGGTLTLQNYLATGTGIITNNAALNLDATGNYSGAVTGSGTTYISAAGINITATTNTPAAWNINNGGIATITQQANIGNGNLHIDNSGLLNISAANWTLTNTLAGTGTLAVNLTASSGTFAFAATSGTNYAGTVHLGTSTYDLSGQNTAALAQATLATGTGNRTTVGTGTQKIGNLTLDGGRMDFPALLPADIDSIAKVQTGTLTLHTGTIAVELPAPSGSSVQPQLPLLQQDDLALVKLISSDTTIGTTDNIALVAESSGTTLSVPTQVNINQSGTLVATGTYDYSLATTGSAGSGLYVNYALRYIDIHANQTLTLDGDTTPPAGGSELTAIVGGTGNLAINATNAITLNANNTYTGTTLVNTGTLIAGADHALGDTTAVAIANVAALDLNGKTQTIGTLDTKAGSTLNLNSGTLTLINGGTSNGTLTGAGQLINNGNLTLNNANTALSANILNTGTLALDDTQSIGATGTLTTDGLTTFTNVAGTITKTISGTGTVSIEGTSNVTLGTANTLSGTWNIAAPAYVFASSTTNLGTAAIVDDGILAIENATAETLGNALSGTGQFRKGGLAELTISQTNTYAGTTHIDSGTLTLANLYGTGTGNVTNNAALKLATSGTYANNIDGTGTTTIAAATNIAITGSNQTTWQITGTAQVAQQQNLGNGTTNIDGLLNLANAANWTYTNALTGTGTLYANLTTPTGTMAFATTSGSNYAGTVQLGNSQFDLDGNNTAALTHATLQLDAGNHTTIATGTQTIGNLTLNGGRLDFANTTIPADAISTNLIRTGTLVATTGTIAINTPALNIIATVPQLPLLQQDEGNGVQLIASATTTGNVDNLALIDITTGSLITNPKQSNINQSGTTVASGTYDYGFSATGTAGNGLYVAYKLKAVEIYANQTLTLSQDAASPLGADDFTASIAGTGNLAINATNSITLKNGSNTYTGTTLVNSGTLIAGVDNALGNTTALNAAANTTYDLNGHTQTIGTLNTATTSTINLNTGTLTLANGGTLAGALQGGGLLALTSSTLVITQANNTTASATLAPNATLQLNDAAALGATGTIALAQSATLNLAPTTNGTLANTLTGAGTLIKTGTATATITNANTAYTGTTYVQSGTLSATNATALGTTTPINVSNAATLEYRNIATGTIANTISGTGALAITTSTVALSGSNNIATINLKTATATAVSNNALGTLTTTINLDNTSAIVNAAPALQLGTLNLNGGAYAFAPNGTAYRTATIETLGNTAGIFAFNLNFDGATGLVAPGTKADYIKITNDGTAAHKVHINYTGTPGTDATSIELIDAGTATATYALDTTTGKIDIGLNSFTLKKGDASTPLDQKTKSWYLVNDGMSNGGDIIIDTASMLGTDWFYTLDSLHQRMGDLRQENQTENGKLKTGNSDADSIGGNVWARARGYQLNVANDLSGKAFKQYGYGMTAGVDKALASANSTTLLGAMIDMGNIDRQFDGNGTGHTQSLSVGLYATMLHKDGWYADLAAKADRYKNKFDARTPDQQTISGNYTNQTQGLSLEVGRQIKRTDGWWIEPSLQAATLWINGASYDTTNSQKIHVNVGSSTAQQYRAQLRFGRQLLNSPWYPYAKVAAVAVDGDGGTITAQGQTLTPDYTGKRAEFGFGTTYKIDANSQLYLDYEYAKAALYERPWSINLGYRRVW